MDLNAQDIYQSWKANSQGHKLKQFSCVVRAGPRHSQSGYYPITDCLLNIAVDVTVDCITWFTLLITFAQSIKTMTHNTTLLHATSNFQMYGYDKWCNKVKASIYTKRSMHGGNYNGFLFILLRDSHSQCQKHKNHKKQSALYSNLM